MPLVDPELMVQKRTSSAQYRMPLTRRPPSSSEQHRPPPQRAAPAASTKTGGSKDALAAVDVVTQDKIWRQGVKKEVVGAKQWKGNWGFLTEYDDRGEPREPEELPDKVNMFSDDVPNTNSGNYGKQAGTELGLKMQQLEFKLYSGNRRRKMGKDLICY